MMKAVFAGILALMIARPVGAEELRIAVTTSFHNSGLAEVLVPRAEAELGLDIQLLVVGTGQALRLGRAGDVDAVLVHSRAAEEAFVAEGYGTHRREIMYNDFVLIGPAADPAGAGDGASIVEALGAVAGTEAALVSRGDDSGTHRRETALWDTADVALDDAGAWYRSVGAGMGATLNAAAALDAYVLSDRASWLNFGNKAGLAIVFDGDPALFNQYAYLPVDPDRHPTVAQDAALAFEDWLTGATGQGLIGDYTLEEQQLFVPNATEAADKN